MAAWKLLRRNGHRHSPNEATPE
uniref:Uncharacterized protein n=1 Tax=Anguilla anguilla TaxID=7936 RepID=A0A0E9TGP7_ANGAN